MNPKLKLSKLDCARRQLELAIELYFMERDPVSVHTLTGAVRQILSDISKHRGANPLFTEIEALKGIVILGKEKELSKLFKAAQNFFKHADEDPEDSIDFSPEINELLLWEASFKYAELSSENTPAMKAMSIWFHVRNPHLFTYDEAHKVIVGQAAHLLKSMSKTQFFQQMLTSNLLRGFK
jgi:hypothetical protein